MTNPYRFIHRMKMNKKAGLLLILITLVAIPLVVQADQIANNLDSSVDAVLEVLPLNYPGSPGSVLLYVYTTDGDGKPGCNLTGGPGTTFNKLTVNLSSNNTAVATVSPSSVEFTGCGTAGGKSVTITPVGVGSATISATGPAQLGSGGDARTFSYGEAAFTVNVSGPPNTAPSIAVVGVSATTYEIGSVPTAMCSVTDAEDGPSTFPATLSAISGPLAAYGLGNQTATCSYTDNGGLTAVSSITYEIVDTIPPEITFISRTTANSNGWNNGDVTVYWSCSDGGSGVVAASVSQTVSAEGANQSATGTCTDHAGNTASDTQSGINIDKTAPTILGGAAPAPNGNGWNNTNVTVSFTCSDSLSGLDGSCPSSVTVSEGKDQSVTRSVSDKAGNTASATVDKINVDKTPPMVKVTGIDQASYPFGSPPNAGCETTDALSGVAAAATPSVTGGNSYGIGQFTATCSGALDNAGNSGSASVTYYVTYNFSGFFQPVENRIRNGAKAGSAIPVKFSLGDFFGYDIFASGSPGSAKLMCDRSEVDPIEQTVTAGASSLNYDPTTKTYIYVWKTDKAWGNTCRRLDVELNDGTVAHTAEFEFKR